ncbi:MAG: hypothetical protein B9S36_03765 [Verrucomicrobiia bacterium Tous-C2TDCM]|nr:MAG: hypothetical protein B9S36_03765 [Verrucomicrobiae bacterium Tous-C2TDCM]
MCPNPKPGPERIMKNPADPSAERPARWRQLTARHLDSPTEPPTPRRVPGPARSAAIQKKTSYRGYPHH